VKPLHPKTLECYFSLSKKNKPLLQMTNNTFTDKYLTRRTGSKNLPITDAQFKQDVNLLEKTASALLSRIEKYWLSD